MMQSLESRSYVTNMLALEIHTLSNFNLAVDTGKRFYLTNLLTS